MTTTATNPRTAAMTEGRRADTARRRQRVIKALNDAATRGDDLSVTALARTAGFSELVMIMDLRWVVASIARGMEDGGDHQVGGALVEPGEGVTEIHRDSVGNAGREA